jgi:hypothetical protein
MRSSQRLNFAVTRTLLVPGPTGVMFDRSPELQHTSLAYPLNDRQVNASWIFPEENTAVYEAYLPFTYFQPHKVNIEKLPAPEPKYYQFHTKRLWDISSTEQVEMILRKRLFHFMFCCFTLVYLYGFHKDERSFDGLEGVDPFWSLLPKNRPEWF